VVVTGRSLDHPCFVEVDDATLTALDATDGNAWVIDADGDFIAAVRHHDGQRIVLRTLAPIGYGREVEVRLRGVQQ
jgi:hypothetical protein